MQKRTQLLRAGHQDQLQALEKEALAAHARHPDWECTEKLMSATKGGKALYMHCLPADISGVSCKQGEVAATVFDRYRTDTYREAGHKPFVIAAMMLLTRFPDPARVLGELARKAAPRRGV
jgi:ornithine carbamoyltransferase